MSRKLQQQNLRFVFIYRYFWEDFNNIFIPFQATEAKLVIQQQKLSNLHLSKQFGKALRLALRLSQPFTALKVIKKLDYATLEEALLTLDNPSMDQLLGYTVKWNSNTRHSEAAQKEWS